MPRGVASRALVPLADLCGTAIACAETAASGLDAAAVVSEGKRLDTEDAFASTTRLIDLEHAADMAEQAITALVFCNDFDWKFGLSVLELGRALERATDQMAEIGHLLHTTSWRTCPLENETLMVDVITIAAGIGRVPTGGGDWRQGSQSRSGGDARTTGPSRVRAAHPVRH